jgi:hypothetical protein
MLRPLFSISIVSIALSTAQGQSQAPGQSQAETPGLKASQVTVTLQKEGKQLRFRATVMARKDDELTILTAAHCMAEDDKDRPITLLIDHEMLKGTVLSIVRNPSYRSMKNAEIPGADNAIARLRMVRPTSESAVKALDGIKPAQVLAARSYPSADGQTISVHLIDGQGVEHALKAGNHRNPRYLEWGPSYRPIPGDSGGGVFVLRILPEGDPQPILIGIIVGRDDRGGAASLISREMGWISEELTRNQ